jgi:hypothetical protein
MQPNDTFEKPCNRAPVVHVSADGVWRRVGNVSNFK